MCLTTRSSIQTVRSMETSAMHRSDKYYVPPIRVSVRSQQSSGSSQDGKVGPPFPIALMSAAWGREMIGISTFQFALRLFLAIGMGATVGLERQWRQRMAGTRTNALVAAGSGSLRHVWTAAWQ